MKTLLIFALIAALVLPIPVAAADFDVSISMPDSFLVNRTDTATVNIQNNGLTGWFSVVIFGSESWAWSPTSRLQIGAGYDGNATIYVSPPVSAAPKFYSFSIIVKRESTGEEVERQMLIQVRQTMDAQMANFTTSCTECEGKIDFSVDVENIGTEPFSGTLTATFAGVPRSYQLEIPRNDVQHVADSFDLSGFRPGDYNIKLNVSSVSRKVQSLTKDFKISAVQNITYDRTGSSSPFGNYIVLTATNLGNVPLTATMRATITTAWYSVYSGPAPTNVADGTYTWVVDLPGSGKAQIAYTEVFWPLPIIIIALLIVGIIAYLQMAAMTVKKAALGRTVIVPGRDIGISLSVKNARRKADSIIVREIVPSAFTVSGKFDTTKPIIRKLQTGTEIIWKFNEVGAGEERMIHYKITPNVQIYGGCVLSPAIARAKFGSRMIERRSNSIVLEGAQKGGIRKLPVEVEK